jgi:hypothetical protein
MSIMWVSAVKERAAVESDGLDIINLLVGKAGIHLLGQREDIVWRRLGFARKPDVLPVAEWNLRFLQQAKFPIFENGFQCLCHAHRTS